MRVSLPPKGLKLLIIILIILSVFFRFVNLDQKAYTIDEVRGLLRVSGYTSQEFGDLVFAQEIVNAGNIISFEELQKYQRPNSEKSLTDAIKALSGNPEHPPLYYLMARFMIQWFGNPVAARILSVLISFLVFPCLYWLCLELFESPLVGWIGIALASVSPFYLMLAQEARQYSFWIVITLLSSTALLRSLRIKTKRSWLIYGITVALGIYFHLFFLWVAIGHGIYVLLRERFQVSKNLIAYLIASLVGLLSFIPWILVIITQLKIVEQKTKWVSSYKTDLLTRISYLLDNSTVIFVDFQNKFSFNNLITFNTLFILINLILILYSLYFLYRQTPFETWSFIFILVGLTTFSQIIPDIILGGRRSLLSRYLTPSYVGIQISVAYLLATKITTTSIQFWQKKIWQIILILIISLGVISCAMSSQARDWWKGSSSINVPVAAIINQSNNPVIISDADPKALLPLSYMISPQTKLQLFKENQLDKLETNSDILSVAQQDYDVFLYSPSQKLLDIIKKDDRLNLQIVVGASKWFPNQIFLYKLVSR